MSNEQKPEGYLAQERFDKTYITSSEICQRLDVTRPVIHYRRKNGHLPNGIQLFGQQLIIWEREFIEPYLQKWQSSLENKRNAMT